MKTTGILFQADMVRAVLAGRKTLTSLLRGLDRINERPDEWFVGDVTYDLQWAFCRTDGTESVLIRCPYGGLGDRLIGWETWKTNERYDQCAPITIDSGARILFMADESIYRLGRPFIGSPPQWGKTRPGIHLPFKFARLRLEIVQVWPSRLHDMTEEMAIQEGVAITIEDEDHAHFHDDSPSPAVLAYERLWDSINAAPRGDKPGRPWSGNWWVWRIQFRLAQEVLPFNTPITQPAALTPELNLGG